MITGTDKRFVMCLFVSCYHFLLVAKGSERGRESRVCVLLCKSPTGETLLLPLTKGEEEWSKSQRRQGQGGEGSWLVVEQLSGEEKDRKRTRPVRKGGHKGILPCIVSYPR